MKTYELTYIVTPDITSEEAEAKGKEIEASILAKEGTVSKQSNPVAKTLAHLVGKRASGFLGTLEFYLEPEKLAEFKLSLAKDKTIVRHMLIIKRAAEFKKERRTREKASAVINIETEKKEEIKAEEIKPASAKASVGKEKVELKDIEQELDEILGE